MKYFLEFDFSSKNVMLSLLKKYLINLILLTEGGEFKPVCASSLVQLVVFTKPEMYTAALGGPLHYY
ncbi:hypothetical protein D7Z54_11725 [Salibacterium salarium]|uniref:Uncharacterized protein n=1 Tax=Salibacterium salarium TaxID=284579 RepID=A0A3R9QTT5_9BACI|nr:hypothetical protein D7Z54_11725 [Salibacterium salarium]